MKTEDRDQESNYPALYKREEDMKKGFKKGVVVAFDEREGCGVIKDQARTPVLVHFSAITSKERFKTLKMNQEVVFTSVDIEGRQVAKEVLIEEG